MTSTITRAVPSSVGRAVDVDTVAALLTITTHGATVGTHGAPYGGDGILVAMPEHGAVLDFDNYALRGAFYADVLDWVRRVAPMVTAVGASPARYFGAWVDGDLMYLDVVEAFSSAEEERAVAAGRTRGQLAIWHNGRRECIPTV